MSDQVCFPRNKARAKEILESYLPLINSTPALLSLLYDADMTPEQTVTVRGAVSIAAVCEAYKHGRVAGANDARD